MIRERRQQQVYLYFSQQQKIERRNDKNEDLYIITQIFVLNNYSAVVILEDNRDDNNMTLLGVEEVQVGTYHLSTILGLRIEALNTVDQNIAGHDSAYQGTVCLNIALGSGDRRTEDLRSEGLYSEDRMSADSVNHTECHRDLYLVDIGRRIGQHSAHHNNRVEHIYHHDILRIGCGHESASVTAVLLIVETQEVEIVDCGVELNGARDTSVIDD